MTICRYPDYREPPDSPNKYNYTDLFWHILAARLAFVVVFEVFIYFLILHIFLGIATLRHYILECCGISYNNCSMVYSGYESKTSR
jgi:hypothetical protein